MEQENKQKLLLQDLSTRMSHGVICNTPKGDGYLCSIDQTIFGTVYGINIKATTRDYFNDKEVCIKPYLRPLSSMTDEEKNELNSISHEFCHEWLDALTTEERYVISAKMQRRSIELYNSHHLDYNGLISKGLAIAINENNNPYERMN